MTQLFLIIIRDDEWPLLTYTVFVWCSFVPPALSCKPIICLVVSASRLWACVKIGGPATMGSFLLPAKKRTRMIKGS